MLKKSSLVDAYYDSDGIKIFHGDCRDVLPTLEAGSVNCCVTSPPYWGLRDYGTDGQLGLESTPEEYVETMVAVFREVWRVLADDGTLWLNLGDSYASNWGMGAKRKSSWWSSASGKLEGKGWNEVETAIPPNSFKPGRADGLKVKDLVGIPWMVAFALRKDGWYLRSDIIWHKPNPMPENVTDRPTKSHEYLFLLTKSQRYYYDADAIREDAEYGRRSAFRSNNYTNNRSMNNVPTVNGGTISGADPEAGRNRRSVWTIPTYSYSGAHFATFPPKLIEPCIKAGCPEGGLILDPFLGSGTTAAVANKHGCRFVGTEINEEYVKLAVNRFVDANGFRQRSLLVE